MKKVVYYRRSGAYSLVSKASCIFVEWTNEHLILCFIKSIVPLMNISLQSFVLSRSSLMPSAQNYDEIFLLLIDCPLPIYMQYTPTNVLLTRQLNYTCARFPWENAFGGTSFFLALAKVSKSTAILLGFPKFSPFPRDLTCNTSVVRVWCVYNWNISSAIIMQSSLYGCCRITRGLLVRHQEQTNLAFLNLAFLSYTCGRAFAVISMHSCLRYIYDP